MRNPQAHVAPLRTLAYTALVRACPACGEENPDRAKFCSECASALTPIEEPTARDAQDRHGAVRRHGRLDALGERLDPEALRAVIDRYFDAMKADDRAPRRHGREVHRRRGDGGVRHPDGCTRTMRCARCAPRSEMREALDALNAELERDHGVAIAVRTGVNTGEVVAGRPGDRQTLVTGDTVNIAARLEQAAAPGRDPARARRPTAWCATPSRSEPVEPLAAQGQGRAGARRYRLIAVVDGADGHAAPPRRAARGPRARAAQLLADALDARCAATLVPAGHAPRRPPGSARVAPRRASCSAARSTDGGAVLSGRCLPYGEGITYWPVARDREAAAGIAETDDADAAAREADAPLDGEDDAEAIEAHAGRASLGLVRGAGAARRPSGRVRRFLETLARERRWSSVSTISIGPSRPCWISSSISSTGLATCRSCSLCLARPELLDERPGWGGGKMNATTILLEPLR